MEGSERGEKERGKEERRKSMDPKFDFIGNSGGPFFGGSSSFFRGIDLSFPLFFSLSPSMFSIHFLFFFSPSFSNDDIGGKYHGWFVILSPQGAFRRGILCGFLVLVYWRF